jgi:signal peptidase II
VTNKTRWFWGVFTAGVLLDQITKILVVTFIEYGAGEVPIIPGLLSFIHAQNPGAAFGMLTEWEYRHYLFGTFTAGALLVCVDLYRRMSDDADLQAAALGMILSGAVGNAIDRIHKGTVTDFVHVYTNHPEASRWLRQNWGSNTWPAFNVADAALLIGVALFLVHAMFYGEPDDLSPVDDL